MAWTPVTNIKSTVAGPRGPQGLSGYGGATIDAATASLIAPGTVSQTATNLAKAGSPQALDGNKYVLYAGVIRNEGSGFALLPESSNHRPINIDSIETVDTSDGYGYIRINYPTAAATMTVYFDAQPDETLARAGMIMGCSVTPTYTDIRMAQSAPIFDDYIYWSGSAWVSDKGVFTVTTLPSGALQLTHGLLPESAKHCASVQPRGNYSNVAISSDGDGASTTEMKVNMLTWAGAKIATPAVGMAFYASHGGGLRPVRPSLVTTSLYPSSNIWFTGIMGT